MLTTDIDKLTNEEKNFVEYYDKFLPVVETDCTMNKICKYIESQDFNIKQKVKNSEGFDYKLLQSTNPSYNKNIYNSVKQVVEMYIDKWSAVTKTNNILKITKNPQYESFIHEKEAKVNLLRTDLEQVCSNSKQLADMLIYLYYEDKKSCSKTTLWNLVGKQIFDNVREKTKSFYFPIKNQNGSLNFLFENYSIERFLLEDIFIEPIIDSSITNNILQNEKVSNIDNEGCFND